MKDSQTAMRYHPLEPLFLKMIGIDFDLGYGSGAPIAPWRKRATKGPRRTSPKGS
jgi:hypothetical protein